MEHDLREKLERFKIKAEEIDKENLKAFIVDVNDTYYFCNVILVGDATILIENFKGQRVGEREKLFWADIVKFEEYKEKEELRRC